MVLRANFCICTLPVAQGVALRWWICIPFRETLCMAVVLCTLFSVLCTLYSVSCTLKSSCQSELHGYAEVLGCCGVGRRGEERFVELAVIVGREGDKL